MGQYRWLIMPVEVKHREFLSRILLASLAASRGYRILLGKDTMIRRLAPALPQGVIFDKSLGTARHGKPQRFVRLGHKVVVLDEESTGYYGSPEQFLSVRLANETLDACARWYCISDAVKDHAVKLYPNYAGRFLTTGLLRTDIWRPAFHGFYIQEAEKIRQTHGPFILFNSNFGGIIHARGDAFVQKQIKGQKKAWSQVEERTAKIFEEGRPNLEAFIKVLPKVAQWFPDHKIIIRPHPSETVSFWEDQFAGNERFAVSNEGVATPWILSSDMLFHHGCTTGIEASTMGKPHIMYAPHPDEHHDTDVMKAFAPVAKTEADLKSGIEAGLGTSGFADISPEQEKYYANLHGQLAVSAIMDDLDNLAFASGDLPTNLPMNVRARLWMAEKKSRSDKERNYMKQKWPGATTDEINASLAIATEGLGISKAPIANEVFEQVWEIRSN